MRRFGLASVVLLCLSTAAQAATYTVTRLDDPAPDDCLPGDCSLREAVMVANGTTAADTIQLTNNTYALTRTSGSSWQSFDLDVTAPLTVISPGKAVVSNATGIVGPESRVFAVRNTQLTLVGINLRNGNVGDDQGGCLRAEASTVALRASTIALCTAKDGSGILAVHSAIVMEQTTVYRNSGSGVALSGSTLDLSASTIKQNVGDRGGGVYMFGDIKSIIVASGNSAITDNDASMGGGVMIEQGSHGEIHGPAGGWLRIADNTAQNGGGLLNALGSMLLRNVAVTGNVAEIGGGMHTSSIDLRRVRIANNEAFRGGGAVVSCAGIQWPCRIEESSFESNTAKTDGGGMVHSGGGLTELVNVSSYGNRADRGGGIAAFGAVRLTHFTSYGDVATIGNSLVHIAEPGTYQWSYVRNSALLGGCATVGDVLIISEGGNAQIAGTSSCSLTHSSDRPALTSAQAGVSFGDFGGGMPVVGISSATSLLVNRGRSTWCKPRDVRGYTRVNACDIGAFELGAVVP